jgi:hypothetical protein
VSWVICPRGVDLRSTVSQQGRTRGPQRAARSSGRVTSAGHPPRMVVRGRLVTHFQLLFEVACEFVLQVVTLSRTCRDPVAI